MTTKNHYVMFAVASIAAVSIGLTPAFADWQVNWSVEVDPYDTDTYYNWSSCGNHATETILKVAEHSPGTEDMVRVNTDASRCSASEYSAVTVTIDKNGSQVLQQTQYTDLAEFTYPGPLVGGDDIDVNVQYYS